MRHFLSIRGLFLLALWTLLPASSALLAAQQSSADGPATAKAQDAASASNSASSAPDSESYQDLPLLRVNVRLVNLFTRVTDAAGAPIAGLDKSDFALTEDGRSQQIAIFERSTGQPLHLTLAIDTSGSVRKDLASEAASASRFLHALIRPTDQASVLQFSTNLRELTPFTAKLSELDRGLGKLRGDWATALYEAIAVSSEKLGPFEGRKLLVLVSDGDDTARTLTYAEALEAALRNEVMIYSLIVVPVTASAGRDTGGEHALITLAEQTGGKSFYISDGNLDRAFAQISDDLRTQYLIAYYPHNQVPGNDFHRLSLTIPRAAPGSFLIHHRAGYYTDSAH